MQLIQSPSILARPTFMNSVAMTVKVIQALPEHCEIIARFNCEMAMETESKVLDHSVILPGVTTMLQDNSLGYYLVALKEESVVGCLGATFEWSDWRNGMMWWIQSVYVEPHYRRQGVYSSLYNNLVKMAKSDSGCCGIRLYVEKENLGAQKTYEDIGMKHSHYLMYEEDWSDN